MNPDLSQMEQVQCPDVCHEPLTFESVESSAGNSIKLTGCTCGYIQKFEIPLREIGLEKLKGETIYLYRLKSK